MKIFALTLIPALRIFKAADNPVRRGLKDNQKGITVDIPKNVTFLALIFLMGAPIIAMEKSDQKELDRALLAAAEQSDLAQIKQLINEGAHVYAQDRDKRTALHWLLIQALHLSSSLHSDLEAGTPLDIKPFLEILDTAQWLIEKGADGTTGPTPATTFEKSLGIESFFNIILEELKTIDPQLYEKAKMAPNIAALIAKQLKDRIFGIMKNPAYSFESKRALLKYYLDTLMKSIVQIFLRIKNPHMLAPHVADDNGNNPLHWALGMRDLRLAAWIMHNYDTEHLERSPNKAGMTPLELGYGLYGYQGEWHNLIEKLLKQHSLTPIIVANAKKGWRNGIAQTRRIFEEGQAEVAAENEKATKKSEGEKTKDC